MEDGRGPCKRFPGALTWSISGEYPFAVLRLEVLGSGDAFNACGALHSCYLLEHSAGSLMMECGPSVLAGLQRAGIDPNKPDVLLISHLHGDHFGGVPFMYLEYMFRTVRDRPLVIAGPKTIEDRVMQLYRALYSEIERRHPLRFEVVFVELEAGRSAELAGARIEPFLVPHSAEPYSLGYRIETPDGAVLFSGDSAWTEEFVERSRGTKLFLCECCSMSRQSDMHTSYENILANRERLGCERLLLTHLGTDVRESDAVEEQRAHDGLILELD